MDNNSAGNRRPLGRGKRTSQEKKQSQPKNVNHKSPEGNKNDDEELLKLGTKKFQDAQAKMQESLQRHVGLEGYESSSSEEEADNQEDILKNIALSYLDSGATGDNKLSRDLGKTQQYLTDAFRSGSSVCLICIATIRKTEAIWNCESCYGSFHLPCIQKWAKDSIFYQEQMVQDQINRNAITWFCPKCRKEYRQSEKPTKYFCYCGKESDPKFDLWLIPHTCGQQCDKPLKPECGHFCLLLCHPGPCPPCPKMVKTSCFCGAQAPSSKRCSARDWSCRKPCQRLLTCQQHKCSQPCHPGECPPCPRESEQSCLCGALTSRRPCASPSWKCDKVCHRQLECGFHFCKEICHGGSCGPCPRSGERSCPCEKTKVSLPCNEDVPTCGDTCGKLLECDFHTCLSRCHVGSCGTCLQMSVKRCHCGRREKSVPCNRDFRCETKCKNIRDCGRHPCNRKCCDGQCPPCEQLCGRMLGCHNHKCNSRCHQGPCYPCPLTVKVACRCGSSNKTIPCGRERLTKPPRCTERCEISPECHHPARVPHRCHFGTCPPCRQPCLKLLPDCDHKCPSLCHSAVLVKIVQEKKRLGPWEPSPAPEIKVVNQPCPPCQVPIPVTCYGNHETTNIPCSKAKVYSCMKECGRSLACGNHTCSLACHEVKNAPQKTLAGDNCEVCEKPCTLPRLKDCSHQCLEMCHPQPCSECKQMVKFRCHCQLNTLYISCSKWTSGDTESRNEMKCCKNQCPKNLSCGHRCPNLCHFGNCPDAETCKKKTSLRCPCKRIKKDVMCHQAKLVAVECNEKCLELKTLQMQLKDEEEKKMQESQLKKEAEELEKYQRKIEGKKQRKQRKMKEKADDDTSYSKQVKFTLGFSLVALIIAFFYYLLQMQA